VSDRLTSGGTSHSLFLPLEILGAQGDGAVLAKPITVVQPLPRERYGSAPCVGEWAFGIPTKLDVSGRITNPLALISARAPGRWLQDVPEVKAYLSDVSDSPAEPAQGLVLLAHHENGQLWFDSPARRIIREDIVREFPAGSIAFLAACSAAMPQDGNAALLYDLNERGVDAVIASPFAIPAEYGTQLAVAFADVVREARQVGRNSTIADLFTQALERTTANLAAKTGGDYADIGLEYVLVGNPNLVVCSNAPTQGPGP
jgi:hypothetical protein